MKRDYFWRVRASLPGSGRLHRLSLPLVVISRRIAAYSVAAGVLPLGEVHSFCSAMAAINSGAVTGSPRAISTWAAASRALGFFGLLALVLPFFFGSRLGPLAAGWSL